MILQRIGYCCVRVVTFLTEPSEIEKAEVLWKETGIVEEVEISSEIVIKGNGYYVLTLWKKK